MKFNKFLPLISVVSLVLSACGGGGSAGPAATTQYGQVVSISQQQFSSLGKLAFNDILVLAGITAQAGNYPTTFLNIPPYQLANAINTQKEFNYSIIEPKFLTASVNAYAVEYTTPGQNAATQPGQVVKTASGIIALPNSQVRGVVVYFHPTTFGKNQVPSCLGQVESTLPPMSTNIPNYCNVTSLDNTGAGTFAMLATVFTGRGFAVVAPDYLGQGADYSEVHPYVAFPENNVLTAFNMFPALRQILSGAPYNVSSSVPLPLFITGYSEGGGYALKASQMAQGSQAGFLAQNNLQLKITSPQEGAYSLTDQMNFAFANNNDGLYNCQNNPSYACGNTNMMQPDQSSVTLEVAAMNNWNIGSSPYAALLKPLLTSYVLTAAIDYDLQNLSGAYDQSMNHQFWANIPMSQSVTANLYQLFSAIYGTTFTGSQISNAIFSNTTNIGGYDPLQSKNITLYSPLGHLPVVLPANHYGENNYGSIFINPDIAKDPVFASILSTGSTYNWQTSSPINFIHMLYDSAVTVLNSHQAYSCMKNGVSFPGDGYLVASAAPCSTVPSGDLIHETVINNFQSTNNVIQISPLNLAGDDINPLAHSKFWTSSGFGASFGTPYDHGDMFVQGSLVALCTFENSLQNGTNSGVCPSF